MNLSSLDLNLLVVLDALITEAHVGRAARKIGLSQPATSHALKRLRELMGDALLVRVGTRMELTPRSIALRESLAETLQRVETLLIADGFDPGTSSRRFGMMMQDHMAELVIPPLVKSVRTRAPDIRIDVVPWESPASMRPERLRLVDLLFSCTTNEIPGFQRETLFVDTEVTVARKHHPSAASLRKLKAFLDSPHVAVVGRGITEDPVDRWLAEEGVARRIALAVPSYVQALQIVSRTDLLTVVPKRLAQSLARSLSITLHRPPLVPGEYREFLFYPRRAEQDLGSIWLRQLVLQIGESLGSEQNNVHFQNSTP